MNYNVQRPKEYISISLLLGRISNRCKMFERYSLSPKTWAETVKVAWLYENSEIMIEWGHWNVFVVALCLQKTWGEKCGWKQEK